MKKTLLIAGITISLSGFSQITVTSSNMPNIGDQLLQASDTLPAITIGSGGANQTWDFSGLGTMDSTLLTFSDPAWTPYASNFPNSNLAMVLSANRIFYFNKTGSAMEITGFVGDLGYGVMQINTNNPETFVTMPMNYNDTYSDISEVDSTASAAGFGLPGVDSVRLKRVIEHEYDIDGWG